MVSNIHPVILDVDEVGNGPLLGDVSGMVLPLLRENFMDY